MELTLLNLKIKDFKGIKDFKLVADGKSVSILGDNGTGKTTVADAFSWVLFGKDTLDKTDFGINPVDSNNQRIPDTVPTVTAEIMANGKTVAFKRVSEERKNGGSVTKFYVNDVPKKKGEYDQEVANLVNPDLFKMLSNPTYFPTLHWEQQREMLFDTLGDISDEEVLQSKSELEGLNTWLEKYSFKDLETLKKNERKEITDAKDKIPAKVSEAKRSLEDVTGLKKDELEKTIEQLKRTIKLREKEAAQIESGTGAIEKQKQISQLENDNLVLKNEHTTKLQAEKDELQKQLKNANKRLSEIDSQIIVKEASLKTSLKTIEDLENKMKALRDQWHEENSQAFDYAEEEVCPTCSQSLPAEKIEEARAKALASFNVTKSSKLEEINATGTRYSDDSKAEKQAMQATNEAIEKLTNEKNVVADQMVVIEEQTAAINKRLSDIESEVEAIGKNKELIAKLQKEMSQLEAGDNSTVSKEMEEKITRLEQEIKETESQLSKFESNVKVEKRVAELLTEEAALAGKLEEVENILHLIEQFDRTKVTMLENKINSHFKFVQFKMFEELTNGKIKETCQPMVNGVPYDKGLNTAARLNAGIDIINLMSEHHGVVVPIFLDNSEGVTKFLPTKAQLVKLVKPDINTSDKAEKYSKLVTLLEDQIKQEAV